MSKSRPFSHLAMIADIMGDSLLRLGRYFRDIEDTSPDQFAIVAKLTGISLVQAYYLGSVARTFSNLDVDDDRLTIIGWTKIRLIADHINESNCEVLLHLAETSTVRELSLMIEDQAFVNGARCVILYFDPEQYDVFSRAIVAYGGTKSRTGLHGKEEAMVKVLAKSL